MADHLLRRRQALTSPTGLLPTNTDSTCCLMSLPSRADDRPPPLSPWVGRCGCRQGRPQSRDSDEVASGWIPTSE